MKMPDGWKRMAAATVEMRQWEDEAKAGDRVGMFPGIWCGDINIALCIMKDMAKALEGTLAPWDLLDKTDTQEVLLNRTDVEKALKAFEEWK